MGTAGIPQMGARNAVDPALLRTVLRDELTASSQMPPATSQEPLTSVALFIMLCSGDGQPDCRSHRGSMKNKWDVRDRKGRKAVN